VITVEEQSSLFLARLAEWELAELMCVRGYLLDSLSTYLDQVEEYFLQGYIDDGPPDGMIDKNFDRRWNHEEEYWYFCSNDGQDAMIQERWMEECLTRTLKTLKTML